MSRANDRAFPATCEAPYAATDGVVVGTHSVTHGGLTIREHFAAMAMQGLLASRERYADHWRIEWDSIATRSVKAADALIAAMAKSVQP